MNSDLPPRHIELRRSEGLAVVWADGHESFFPVAFLRRLSPSADARAVREALAVNPLTVLPSSAGHGPLRADAAEMVGNYALRITFSDGHSTGLFSWRYLREIDPSGPSTIRDNRP
ncbi:MAG: DUF971 domain-containing protein [Planctomycetes bacterium]|nr:DUF971 domain-containing protein [Planctomycetota bacterium]